MNHDSLMLSRCQMPIAKLFFSPQLGFHGLAKQVPLLYLVACNLYAPTIKPEDEGCVDCQGLSRSDACACFRKQISHKNEGNVAFTDASNDLKLLLAFHNPILQQAYSLL